MRTAFRHEVRAPSHRKVPKMNRLPAAALALLLASPACAQKAKVAIFDFELVDTSLEGELTGAKSAEQARLAGMAVALRQKLGASDRYDVVDIAPVAAHARAQNLQACGRCDASMARELGADLAMTGTVQKVSNLILNINIYIRDANSGAVIDAMSADIRGNTDESWSRGLNWLVRNKLLAPQ